MLKVSDEYHVYGYNDDGNKRSSGGCCNSRGSWSHELKDSEIITTLNWTDAEAERVAGLLYYRSVGNTWSNIVSIMIVLVSFSLPFVLGLDGDDIGGFWIILGCILALLLVKEAVSVLDRRVTHMIHTTFERSGRRRDQVYRSMGVMV